MAEPATNVSLANTEQVTIQMPLSAMHVLLVSIKMPKAKQHVYHVCRDDFQIGIDNQFANSVLLDIILEFQK